MSEYKYRIISISYTEKKHGWNPKMGKIGDIITSESILDTSIENKRAYYYKGYAYTCRDLELVHEFSLEDIYE